MEYIKAKTIVTSKKDGSLWFGTDHNMNIYRGCNHGCIYCDSRSECYSINDFEKVKPKENALEIIRNDLRRKVKKGVVGMGAMSDPYNSLEKELLLTRHSLELIDAFNFGVAIATKSSLVERDIDILNTIKEHSPVLCKITITTPYDEISKKVEPFAPKSSRRFETVKRLNENGIFAGILLMPVLPFIEDNKGAVEEIVKRAYESGAKFIYPAFGMTLRDRQKLYYFEKLNEIFTDEGYVEKYIKQYGNRYWCVSPGAKELWYCFKNLCEKYGILYDMKSITHRYKLGYNSSQLSLFD